MLNYTTLFADLEALYAGAGRDAASFRRLLREVQRVRGDVDEVTREMASDYVAILARKLAGPKRPARLSEQEIELLRGFLGLPPANPEGEQRLLATLAELERELEAVLSLKDQPLRLRNVDGLRLRLDGMEAALLRIIQDLSRREEARRFERAVSGATLDHEWLLRAIERALRGDAVPEESEEAPSPFAGG
ncbi:MAG TPA: hypothetical protein DEA08_15525 [Planctomycetes bacterium]|nr:hypothetical protein [Planctomycetota bacterium]